MRFFSHHFTPIVRRTAASFLLTVLTGISVVGCPSTPPKAITAVFLLDSSASSAPHKQEAIDFIKTLGSGLNSDLDQIVVLRMSQEVYGLYNGKPRSRNLASVLTTFSQVKPDDNGTAYGLGIQRGLSIATEAAKDGRRPAIFILGDGADEKVAQGGNVDWVGLPKSFSGFAADGLLAFVFVDPKWGDRFSQALSPSLGNRVKVITPAEAGGSEAARKLRIELGR